MTHMLMRVRGLVLIAAVALVPSLAAAQESKSAPVAGELVKMLDSMKLDSVAAPHRDGFVSAYYLPGSQLLVVAGKFGTPSTGTERASILIERKMYRDVYTDLNAAAELNTKVFVSDLGANGLQFKRLKTDPFDTADIGSKSYQFDGDWKRAKISQTEYTKTFQETDEQYTQMLQALVEQLKKSS
jgi:hypothetical protein